MSHNVPEMVRSCNQRRAAQYATFIREFDLHPEVVLYLGSDGDDSPTSLFHDHTTVVHYDELPPGSDADLLIFGRAAFLVTETERLRVGGVVLSDNRAALISRLRALGQFEQVAVVNFLPFETDRHARIEPLVVPYKQQPLQQAASGGSAEQPAAAVTRHTLGPNQPYFDPAQDIIAFQRLAD